MPATKRKTAAKSIQSKTTRNRQSLSEKALSLRQKPDEFVECPANTTHALQTFGYYHWRTDRGRGICRVQVCITCGTFREEFLYPDGTRAYPLKYSHPDGYKTEGQGRLFAREARQELLRRVTVVHASPDDLKGLPETFGKRSRTSRRTT